MQLINVHVVKRTHARLKFLTEEAARFFSEPIVVD